MDWVADCQHMASVIAAYGIRDRRVLSAMASVPRHLFVPAELAGMAYEDTPLPIGHEATISQPCIVAMMTQLLAPRRKERVLEVGTGSGYQAAILAGLAGEVYSVELVPELAEQAHARLLSYANVHVRAGDGYRGWAKVGPFDSIIVTCGAKRVPPPLLAQLKPGGKMVIPVGRPIVRLGDHQVLRLITKGTDGEIVSRDLMPVVFVPLRRRQRKAKLCVQRTLFC